MINTDDKKTLQRKADEERIQKLRLMDDDFMTLVFDNNREATELILNIFLDRHDMKVLSVVSQKELKNPNGRSVKLDIYAVDSEGKHYDIEIQRQDRGAGRKRARFNSSMLDTRLLKPGQSFDEMPDSYVIFITENDVLGNGSPIYRFSRMNELTHEAFDDGSYIIYVNGAYNNEADRIGKLMHDFRCSKADDMHHPVLADKVRYFKETEGGTDNMCKLLEEMRNEAAMQAAKQANIATAMEMIEYGQLSLEIIARFSHLTLEEVKALAEGQTA